MLTRRNFALWDNIPALPERKSGPFGPPVLLLWCSDALAGNRLVSAGTGARGLLRSGSGRSRLVEPAGTPQRVADRGASRPAGAHRDHGRSDDGAGNRFRVAAVGDQVRVGAGAPSRPAPPAGTAAGFRDRGA